MEYTDYLVIKFICLLSAAFVYNVVKGFTEARQEQGPRAAMPVRPFD